ncbi:MAG TPA: SpoIIE family protein phosphatase [Spirochaetia bacterium]|nr:SpoIIE family protein phosphatase [Spirochaetia bacterium]
MTRAVAVVSFTLLAGVTAAGQELFWERPEVMEQRGVRYSSSAAGGGRMALAWEEVVPTAGATGGGTLYLSAGASTDGVNWTWHRRFYGPLPFSGLEPGSEPLMYSMIVRADGTILVAVTSGESEVTVLSSSDEKLTFEPVARLTSKLSTVAPYLFLTDGGRLILFATQSPPDSTRPGGATTAAPGRGLTLAWSSSPDGRTWAPFSAFVAPDEPGAGIQIQPDHASFQGREVIAFQGQKVGEDNYQVYFKESRDGGVTWSRAKSFTGQPAFAEKVGGTSYTPDNFTNQRPRIAALGTALGLVWERTLVGRTTPNLYYCELADDGSVVRPPERVDPTDGSLYAQIILAGTREMLLYEQSAAGTYRVVLSQRGKGWLPEVIGRGLAGSSQSPHGIVFKGSLYLFWEVRGTVATSLVALRPKTSVASPTLIAVGFQPGMPVRSDAATIRWRQPDDSVGIESYEVTVSQGDKIVEHRRLSADTPDISFTRPVTQDGIWHFEVVAQDVAGNKSGPVSLDFVRKTTAPQPVVLTPPPQDADGFLPENSFTIAWAPADDKDIAGYTWEEQRVASSIDEYEANRVKLIEPPDRPLTNRTTLTFNNLENGVHVLTVKAIDRAGNVSAPATIVLQLNKFQAFTAIYAVQRTEDELGNVQLTLRGRGFLTNGAVQEVYISRSDRPPYDRVFTPGPNSFTVAGDTQIRGPRLDNSFPSGSYMVGLLQTPGKPYFWPGGRVDFEAPGTVRFGTFSVLLPRWVGFGVPRYGTSIDTLIVVLLVAMLSIIAIFSTRRLASLAQEGVQIRNEVLAVLEGKPSAAWEERNARMKELQRRGAGLRLKFTLLMVVLVTIIVLIVSVPLGVQMIGQQSQSLADGLEKRTSLLIGTIAASAEAEIRKGATGGGDVGIGSVTDTIKPMEEAKFTTITGPADPARFPNTPARDFVWASNSDSWKKRKSSGTFQVAMEQEKDDLSQTVVPDLQRRINDAAPRALAAELSDWQKARDRFQELDAIRGRSAAEQAEENGILKDLPKKVANIDSALKTLPENAVDSVPPFDPHKALAPRYLFYKPIVFFVPADKSFYQGLVRLDVDTTTITRQTRESRNGLIRSTALIALAAIGLGILGAVIMASITVTPIRRLAAGVAKIRDTEDKEELKDHRITVRTRDEIGTLAATVNDMTQGLVKAAAANKELMLGKDIQKMFLPLEKDAEARKGTTAGEETPQLEIYGYYEGAKGVSGDYFDFKKLDDVHYAFIKCDVAGKGVPAALIMVEVATLFINYIRDWPKKKESVSRISDPKERQAALRELERIDSLVYTINDMLEERGFKGRFAALTVCIFNAATGTATVCNAGDNIVHIYRSAQGQMMQYKLPESPAAGVFPSMLVEMKSGFPQVPQKLERGDALFLFTDGFEEAKRSFRNSQWEVVPCDEPDLKEGEQHLGTHSKGQTSEEFGTPRIEAIVAAVFSRGRYRLVRHHTADPTEQLDFDFATCNGSVKDAVLALVAVEKVFRLRAEPGAAEGNRVVVDAKVEAFLREHFVQYQRYFSHKIDGQQNPASLTFTHLKEDEQYDDLTMLVIRRK